MFQSAKSAKSVNTAHLQKSANLLHKLLNRYQLNLQHLKHGRRERGYRRPETGDGRQETGYRRHEIGDRKRETGEGRQREGDRRRETGFKDSGDKRQERVF